MERERKRQRKRKRERKRERSTASKTHLEERKEFNVKLEKIEKTFFPNR